MKPITAISLFSLTVLTAAQDITTLPQCAQQPILNAITNSGCPLTDITCICGNEKFVSGLLAEIPGVCTKEEVEVTAQFAEDLCFGYGVPLDLSISGVAVGTSTAPPIGSSTSTKVPASTTTSMSNLTSTTPTSTGVAAATSSTPPSAGTILTVDLALKGTMIILSIGAFMWI